MPALERRNAGRCSKLGVLDAAGGPVIVWSNGFTGCGEWMVLKKMHYNPAVLDDASDLERFKLVIWMDTTVVTKTLREKLETYYANGGKPIISNRGGMNEHGEWVLDFLPIKYAGELEMRPTFWRTSKEFWPEVSGSDRVFYEPGLKLECHEDSWVLIDRVLAYFERSDTHFMLHLQAPPVKNVVIFADPIFTAYRQSGSSFIRNVLERCLHNLIGPPAIGHGLARSILCVPRAKDGKHIVTLLHYIPQRKALNGDVLEEASSFAGETLRISGATKARIFDGPELKSLEPEVFVLPVTRERLMIEAEWLLCEFGQFWASMIRA